jgi:hypothetical protein
MRTVAQLVGRRLLVGFVKYWWLIALVVAAVAAWKYAPEVRARSGPLVVMVSGRGCCPENRPPVSPVGLHPARIRTPPPRTPDSDSRTCFPHQPHGIVRSDHDARRLLTSPNPLKRNQSRRAVEKSQTQAQPERQDRIGVPLWWGEGSPPLGVCRFGVRWGGSGGGRRPVLHASHCAPAARPLPDHHDQGRQRDQQGYQTYENGDFHLAFPVVGYGCASRLQKTGLLDLWHEGKWAEVQRALTVYLSRSTSVTPAYVGDFPPRLETGPTALWKSYA